MSEIVHLHKKKNVFNEQILYFVSVFDIKHSRNSIKIVSFTVETL